jgi:predicted O-methyltransferase YrrM
VNPLNLNRQALSQMIWQRIFENAQMVEYVRPEITAMAHDLGRLESKAENPTGSISVSSIWALTATAYYFAPRTVVEVGTYIGRSTYALSEGMTLAGVDEPLIYTCDLNNDIAVENDPAFATSPTEIYRYPRRSSTEMFEDVVSRRIHPDMIFLDGRLPEGDVELIKTLKHRDTIFALDDFEGIEKGVANYSLLQRIVPPFSHILVYPPDRETLTHFGLRDQCTTALVLPNTLFRLTAQ